MAEVAPIRRVGLIFSGGPAPGANAVIAAVASAFRRDGVEVVGLLHGYSGLIDYDGDPASLAAASRPIENSDLWGLRNAGGVLLGTARAHPGTQVRALADLDDPERSASLARVYRALRDLELDALVSIGGDGTLRTAYLLSEYGRRRGDADRPLRVVHVPKTIDNDYGGIDFTFGFFTAVDVMAKSLLNLRADAIATLSYYVVATMGRSAGWLAYGVAVAGEAHMVVAREDVEHAADGSLADGDGRLDIDKLVDRIVDLVVAREARGKRYGTVVLAEGLTGLLPEHVLGTAARDRYGHVSFSSFDLSREVAARVVARYRERTGRAKKVTGVQLGYESRSAPPHAFDVMLGTQLGHGAYRALVERDFDAHMVSVAGQLALRYVPFADLVDPATLVIRVRRVPPESDFRRLALRLGTRVPKG